MTIILQPEQEQLVAQAMETGAYRDPEEVIRRALEMLHSENESLRQQREEIGKKIDRAFEQFERGNCFTAEQSIADMEKRKRAWLSEHKG
jgi:antitoxin ParD1/3/4